MMIDVGVETGWTSPNLVRFNLKNSSITLTKEQTSWVASINGIGGIAGAFIGSLSIGYFGSRNSIIATLLSMCLKWLCLIFAYTLSSKVLIYVFRFIGGITSTMAYSTFPLYLSEVALPEIRGALVVISLLGLHFGKIISTVIESYFEAEVTIPI